MDPDPFDTDEHGLAIALSEDPGVDYNLKAQPTTSRFAFTITRV